MAYIPASPGRVQKSCPVCICILYIQLSDERRQRLRRRRRRRLKRRELFIGVDFSRGHMAGEVLRIPDVGHFKAPPRINSFGTARNSRARSVVVEAVYARWQRSNNTDLSHAKCDFISSSACPETPFV